MAPRIAVIGSVAAFAFATAALVLFVARGAGEGDLRAAEARRFASWRLADELRQSSDDLTRMARTYAATGDERFAGWFADILAIRDGEAPRPLDAANVYWDLVTATGEAPRASGGPVPLLALMREAGFSAAQIALFTEAETESDDLTILETRAMNAVRGLFEDGAGDYAVRGDPDRALAIELLHGEEYHLAKARIMRPIERLLASVEAEAAADVAEARDWVDALGATMMAMLALALAGGGAAALAVMRLGSR